MNLCPDRYPRPAGAALVRVLALMAMLVLGLALSGILATPASAQVDVPDVDLPGGGGGGGDDDDDDGGDNDDGDDDTDLPDLPDLPGDQPDNPLDPSSGGGSGGGGDGSGGGGSGSGGGNGSSDSNDSGSKPLGSTFDSFIVGAAPLTPLRLDPFPIVRIRGTIVRGGVSLQIVSVFGPSDATVEALCSGRRCPVRRLVRAAAASSGPRLLRFSSLEHVFIPTGTRIRFKVLAPGRLGKYTRFRIRSNRVPLRGDLCMLHGAASPISCPG